MRRWLYPLIAAAILAVTIAALALTASAPDAWPLTIHPPTAYAQCVCDVATPPGGDPYGSIGNYEPPPPPPVPQFSYPDPTIPW